MKKNIALVAGGFTGESVISLNSAKQIEKNLDSSIYNVFMIEINNDGWFYRSADQRLSSVDKNDFSITDSGKKINFDCAFIIVHGTPGEDGKLQGYFDLIGLPYTSCDTTTSAITMNKAYTKVLVNDTPNLYTAKSLQLFSIEDYRLKSLQETLQLPLFIKPNNGGSSIGMSKVSDWYHLDEAIAKAFKEGSEVLIEEFIQGREFSVGIYKVKGNINVLPITEIKTSKEFFDYEAKYTDGVTEEITPADLDQNIVNKVHAIVKDVYKKLNCKGMIRIDFILEQQKNDFYFIEVNTTPGQSENSIIPQQVRAEGNNMKNFYGLLVEEALTVK
jgi:D-alanine-D-alanine ligase